MLRNRQTGAITIAQWPNAALTLFGLCAGLNWITAPEGPAGTILRGVGTAALIVWAADELARGVNPWRRLLGAGVLIGIAVPWLAGMAGSE